MASGYLHNEKSNSLAAEINNTNYGIFKSGNLSSKNQHNYSTQIDINGMLRHQNSVIRSDEKSQFQSVSNIENKGFGPAHVPIYKNSGSRKFVSPQISRKNMDTITQQDVSRNQRGNSTLAMSITPTKVGGHSKNLTI